MIWHRCDLKLPSLFGPACCGREATTYDRAQSSSVLSIRRNGSVSSANFERSWVRFIIGA